MSNLYLRHPTYLDAKFEPAPTPFGNVGRVTGFDTVEGPAWPTPGILHDRGHAFGRQTSIRRPGHVWMEPVAPIRGSSTDGDLKIRSQPPVRHHVTRGSNGIRAAQCPSLEMDQRLPVRGAPCSGEQHERRKWHADNARIVFEEGVGSKEARLAGLLTNDLMPRVSRTGSIRR